jgi:SAM-dependent methyltransferase
VIAGYQESECFRNALEEHLSSLGIENHPQSNVWRTHHLTGVGRTLKTLELLEPFLGLAWSEASVLDLGCATGSASIAFRWKGCTDLVGVDVSRDFFGLRLAQVRAEAQGFTISFLQANGYSLPIAQDQMDFCFCDWVLEHVERPSKLIAEVYRVLKPGGMAYFSTNNRLWPMDSHSRLWGLSWLPRRCALRYVRWRKRHTPVEGWNVWLLTLRQVKKLMIDIGFDLVATWSDIYFRAGSSRWPRLLCWIVSRAPKLDALAPSLYLLVRKPSQ